MKTIAQFLALLAVILLPYHTVAAQSLSCPRMTHDESMGRYLGLTEALGTPLSSYDVRADVFNRFGYAPGDPVDNSSRLEIIHEFLKDIETEIVLAALKSTVESLYFIYEPKELKNSLLRLETKRIARKAVTFICQSACQTLSKSELIKNAQEMVDRLEELHTKRFTIDEIKEDLEINFKGLNSILNYRDKNQNIDLAGYQHHYQVLKSSFPGFLINIPRIKNHFGVMFTLDDYDLKGRRFINPTHKTSIRSWKVKRAVREHFQNLTTKWTNFNHRSLFKFKWYDKLNYNNIVGSIEGNSKHIAPSAFEERLLLLSKYLASSPTAVANVLQKTPEYFRHLCWIIENMDRATSSWYITASLSSLDSYLMPLTIGLLFFAGGFFSAGIWLAGLILLNTVTAIDLAKRAGDRRKLERETRFHSRVEGTELETYQTSLLIEDQKARARKEKWMSGLIIAMEIGALGAAKGFSVYAKKLVTKMSDSSKISRLMKPYHSRGMRNYHKKRNYREMFARVETDKFVKSVISKNKKAYDKAMKEFYEKGYRDYDLMHISFAIKHAKKKEAMKILLNSRTTAFGRAGFNIELMAEAVEQIIVHLNTPAITDFTAFEILFRIMTGDYE